MGRKKIYTIETCKDLIKECGTKKEFREKYRSAYTTISNNKWDFLYDCFNKRKDYENTIILGDSCEKLELLKDDSIDLVVTSPPYDNLRKYNGIGLSWNHDKFMCIAKQLQRVLKPGGVIVWVVNDKTENGSKTGTAFRQVLYFREIGLNINDTMIWKKTNPMPQVKQPRYSACFEYMFILSKGLPKHLIQ